MKKNMMVTWAVSVVLSAVIATPSIGKASESGTTLFSDDFESYPIDTFPSADGWILVWNGKGTQHQVVSDAYSFTGEKSLQLWGRPSWSSVAQRKFSTDAPVIGYECAIRIDSIGTGGPGREESIGFFNRDVYIWGRGYAVVLFNHDDGEIKAEDGTVLGDWQPGVWYQVKVILDRRTNTYATWIDGQFKGEGYSTTHSDTELIDALALMSDHAGVKVYYDDVSVFEVKACEPGWGVSNVRLNGSGTSVTVDPGDSVRLQYDFQVWNGSAGPTAIRQVLAGLVKGTWSQVIDECAYSAVPALCPNKTSGSFDHTFNVPIEPGTYHVVAAMDAQYTCADAKNRFPEQADQGWTEAVATITVGWEVGDDYGDAPDPGFPTLYQTHSTPYPGRRGPYHLDVTKEWIGYLSPSTTTIETDALVVDNDFDDGPVQVRRAIYGGVPTQIGFVSVPVTAALRTSGDIRYLNILVDFNGDGRWRAYSYGGVRPQEEWVAKNVALTFPGMKTFVSVNAPFVWLDPRITIGSEVWLRATLTTERIDPSIFGHGDPGWDGSGPDAGFARGETEDQLVTLTMLSFHPVPPGRKPRPPQPPQPPPPGPGPGGGPGPGPGPGGGAGQGEEPTDTEKKHPVPDIPQEPNECGPTAAANSLYYLGAAHGFSKKLPGSPEKPRELIELLKKKMNWTSDGVTDANFVAGKLTIAEALDLPIVTKYMDDGICKIPDTDWILAELKRCEDVEIGMTFDEGGGHWVTATGFVRYPNGDIVIEVHDPDDDLDGEATYRLGDRGDRYPSLLDYPLLNRIDIVVSESPVCAKDRPVGDLNEDCIVDFDDFAILARDWLSQAGCIDQVECFPVGHWGYETWVVIGKPACWCCPNHCYGDFDCDGVVAEMELSLIEPLIGVEHTDPEYLPCLDFNKNLMIDADDLNIVLVNYEKILPGDCLTSW